MKRMLIVFLSLVIAGSMLLTACTPVASTTQAPAENQPTAAVEQPTEAQPAVAVPTVAPAVAQPAVAVPTVAPAVAPLVKGDFVVPLGWILNDEFVAEVAAQELGYYADSGLPKVTFVAGGGSTGLDPIKSINGLAAQVKIGIAATIFFVIQAHAAGLDVVVVGSQLQYDPTAYITLLKSGEERTIGPCDFKGRIVAQQTDSQWLAKALGEFCPKDQGGPLVASTDFTIIPAGFDVSPLTSKQADYLTGFAVNQPYMLVQQGLVQGKDWDLFLASDFIPLYYADPIVTTHAYIMDHPEVVDAFVKATIKGLQYNLDYPDKSVEIASNIEGVDPGHAKWRIPAQNKLVVSPGATGTETHGLGWTDPTLIQTMIQFLYDNGQIDHVFDANEIIDNTFLPGPGK